MLFVYVFNRLLKPLVGSQLIFKWVWPTASLQGPLSEPLQKSAFSQIGVPDQGPLPEHQENTCVFFHVGFAEGSFQQPLPDFSEQFVFFYWFCRRQAFQGLVQILFSSVASVGAFDMYL